MTGQYLDTLHPATCDGDITALSLCYPSSPALPQAPLGLLLRVWRRSKDQTLRMVREVSLKVQIFSEPSNDSRNVCGNWTLDRLNYIELMHGDVLGVLLPVNSDLALLPVVTNTTDAPGLYRSTRDSSNFDLPLGDSDLEFKGGLSLNIYAEYAATDGNTDTILVNTTTQTSFTSHDATSLSPQLFPSPTASIEPTGTSVPLTSTEPQLSSVKVSANSSTYLPTRLSNLPLTLETTLSTVSPSVDTVSASTSISTSKTSVTSSRTGYIAGTLSSTFRPLMSPELSTTSHRSQVSVQPLPTLTREAVVSTEPGLRFSPTLAEHTATLSRTSSVVPFSTRLPLHSPLASILSMVNMASRTSVSRPTHTLGNDISTTLSQSMSEFPLLSLTAQTTFVSVSESPLITEQQTLTVSSDMPTLTVALSTTIESSVMAASPTHETISTLPAHVVTPTPSLSPSLQTTTPFLTNSNSNSVQLQTHSPEATVTPFPSPTPTASLSYSLHVSEQTVSPSTSLQFTPLDSSVTVVSSNPQLPEVTPSTTLNSPTLSRPFSSSSEHPNQTPVITDFPTGKDTELAGSLISVIVAVCILFATLSGCIMLSSIFIVHCHKISKVEQITRRIIPSIGEDCCCY